METGLRRLRYFQGLAVELNFRRAAAKLGLTQPALSRAIALLEDDVGAMLFHRSNREVSLTPAGAAFAVGCERVLAALDGAVTQARKVADGQAGNLVISYTDTAVSGRLPDIVQSFRLANPEVTIHLRQAYTQRQLTWLEEGQIDIAFLTGPTEGKHYGSITVQLDHFIAILPIEHELTGQGIICLKDLAEYPFVLGDLVQWSVYNESLFKLCKASGFEPRIVQTAPDSRGIIGLVSCGMGISVQTESLAQQGDQRVVFKRLHDCDATLSTQAVWNTRFPQPAKTRMIEHLKVFAV